MGDDDRTREQWLTCPLGELIEHIIERYHRKQALQFLALRRICDEAVGREGVSDDTLALIDALESFVRSLVEHADKEERVLFPWLLRDGRTAGGPIRVLCKEHDSSLSQLSTLRRQLAERPDVDTTLLDALDELGRELEEHVDIEDNVLFPRAVAGR